MIDDQKAYETSRSYYLNNYPDMRSVNDPALNFDLSPNYIRSLAKSGKIKAVRISDKPNSKILINQASLAEYFESNILNCINE